MDVHPAYTKFCESSWSLKKLSFRDVFRRGGTKAKMRFRTGDLIGGVRIPQKLPKPEMSIRTRSVALTKLKRGRRGLNAKDNKTRAQAMPSLAETRDAQRRTRGQVWPQSPHQRAPRRRRASAARAFRRCKHPACPLDAGARRNRQVRTSTRTLRAGTREVAREVAQRAQCHARVLRSGRRLKFGLRCAQWCNLPWRPRNFARPACGPRRVRCGGRAHVLDRTNCQAGVWLAFGCGKCGCLLALTPRERACVLVAVEMPTFSFYSGTSHSYSAGERDPKLNFLLESCAGISRLGIPLLDLLF